MTPVMLYLLHHRHVSDDKSDEDVKLIGIYTTSEAAEAAIARVQGAPGFVDHPDGFEIAAYEVDRLCPAESRIAWRQLLV